MAYTKHADARDAYTMSFAAQMADAETITGTPTVRLVRGQTNVTTQFVSLPATADGQVVGFTMNPASTGEQARGNYIVYVSVETSAGRLLVATTDLTVTDTGRVA
jgi:hypothetical protein